MQGAPRLHTLSSTRTWRRARGVLPRAAHVALVSTRIRRSWRHVGRAAAHRDARSARTSWSTLQVFDPAELARLSHPFTLWWQTPPPVARNDTLLEVLDDTHHLNVRTRCRLPDALVVDRCAALDALEPNRALQRRFWWAGGEEQPHLHAEANHAFNHALLHKLEAVPPRMRSPLWRAMSTGGARLRRLLGAAA